MRDKDEKALRARLVRATWLLVFLAGAGFLLGAVVFPPFGAEDRLRLGPPALTPALLGRICLYLVLLASSAWMVLRLHLERRAAKEAAARGLKLRPHAMRPACPFCRGELGPADLVPGVVRCPTCEVAHHGECWKEHGGCATLACGRSPQAREAARERVGG